MGCRDGPQEGPSSISQKGKDSMCRIRAGAWPKSNMLTCWGLSGKEATCQLRRHGFDPWVRKIPWRKQQPTPVSLPGKSHEQRSLMGYSLWGGKGSDTTEHAHTHVHKSTGGYGVGSGEGPLWAGSLHGLSFFLLAPREGGQQGFLGDFPVGG